MTQTNEDSVSRPGIHFPGFPSACNRFNMKEQPILSGADRLVGCLAGVVSATESVLLGNASIYKPERPKFP